MSNIFNVKGTKNYYGCLTALVTFSDYFIVKHWKL